jgi:hypothetical protein
MRLCWLVAKLQYFFSIAVNLGTRNKDVTFRRH